LIALQLREPLWIDLGDGQHALSSASADGIEGSLLHKAITRNRRRRFVTNAQCNSTRGGSV
jgi:hypothetical protein